MHFAFFQQFFGFIAHQAVLDIDTNLALDLVHIAKHFYFNNFKIRFFYDKISMYAHLCYVNINMNILSV